MENNKKIYVIGAGVSGLIAAFELEKEGYRPVIIEKSGDVGGRVKTLQESGFSLDLGFQVLLSAYPMARKYLNMEALQLRKLESGALIYVEGKSYRIGDPLRNAGVLFSTLLADIGALGDKLKILKLNKLLKSKTLEEIFESREKSTLEYLQDFGFSEKIIERFFRPFFAGIFLEPDLRTSSRMFEFVYKMFGEGYATIPKLGIGEISRQLKEKLQYTEFVFNSSVSIVTNDHIVLDPGKSISHEGVVITGDASDLIPNMRTQQVNWKSCMCHYFEVDQTNIPTDTIALVADKGKYANNLYAYNDPHTGKTVLSVTTLENHGKKASELIDELSAEVKQYTGAKEAKQIKSYDIKQALPDIQNLKMTTQPSESRVLDQVFLAGDYLYNGSLNAAMESGRLAALGLIQKKKGLIFQEES